MQSTLKQLSYFAAAGEADDIAFTPLAELKPYALLAADHSLANKKMFR